MSIKLYSYGDSHAAGQELGTVPDLGKAWLKENFGVNSRYDIDQKTYNTKVRPAWENYIRGRSCNAKLSYAGQFAKLLDVELIDRAIPGSSNDWSVMRLLEDLPKLNKDDIVLFSVCTPTRFISGRGEGITRTQIQWQPLKVQRVLYKYGPNEKSYNIWNQGLIHLIKSIPCKTYIIKTNKDSIKVKGQDTTRNLLLTKTSFTQFALKKAGHDDIRYPVGHIHEAYHRLYAEYLEGLV
jgi:hypothetical protein